MRFVPGLLGLALVATLAHASRADACVSPRPETLFLLSANATIPANLHGLPFVNLDDPKTTVRLLDAAGAPVAAAFEGQLLVPASPFVPGSYTVEIQRETGAVDSTPFVIGASAPLPTSAAVVTVGNARHASAPIPGGASCTHSLDASVVDVTVKLAADYLPYRALVTVTLFQNETNEWQWTRQDGEFTETLAQTFSVARDCTQPATRAAVQLAMRIRGTEVTAIDAAADVDFAACSALPTGGVSATTETVAPTTSMPPATPPASTEGGGGCSTTRGQGGGGAMTLTAVIGLALARRLRRREWGVLPPNPSRSLRVRNQRDSTNARSRARSSGPRAS